MITHNVLGTSQNTMYTIYTSDKRLCPKCCSYNESTTITTSRGSINLYYTLRSLVDEICSNLQLGSNFKTMEMIKFQCEYMDYSNNPIYNLM